MKKYFILLIIAIFGDILIDTAAGQKITFPLSGSVIQSIDSIFITYDKENSPGCALAILKNGSIIYKKGYGMANLENAVPIKTITMFNLASVSKQFSAFSILLLEEQGKLSVDDEITKYLPELSGLKKKITIRQMINHISGLRDYEDLLLIKGWNPKDFITQEDMLNIMAAQKDLNYTPGEKYLYSNTNYTLLAEIVKRVSGKNFPDFIQENIFNPLGMKNSIIRDDLEDVIKNKAESYYESGKDTFRISLSNNQCIGQGNIFSNVEDLSLWMSNYYERKIGNSRIYDKMFEQGSLNKGKKINYAFGLTINDYRGIREVYHTGSRAGYRAVFSMYPEYNLGIIILSNFAKTYPYNLSRKICDILLKEYLAPVLIDKNAGKRNSIKVTDLKKIIGDYETQPGYIIKIFAAKDTLFARINNQNKFQIFPNPGNIFLNDNGEIKIQFKEFNNEKADIMILTQKNIENEFYRKCEFDSSKVQWNEFIGEYYSEELNISYRIEYINNILIAKHMKHKNIVLKPVYKDEFKALSNLFGTLRFIRNNENEVIGMDISSGTAWHINFKRIN